MKCLLFMCVVLSATLLRAASPGFASFNTNQFGTAGRKIVIAGGASITNANLLGATTAASIGIGVTNVVGALSTKAELISPSFTTPTLGTATATSLAIGVTNVVGALSTKAELTSPSFTTPSLGVATGTTLDTGQGANELYDMNQNVMTTSTPQFARMGLGIAADSAPATLLYGVSDGGNSVARMEAYGTGTEPTFSGRRARGTLALPTVVQASDILVRHYGAGYDGAAFQNRASWAMRAHTAWTTTSTPTRHSWFITPTNSTTLTEVMRLSPSGQLTVDNVIGFDEKEAMISTRIASINRTTNISGARGVITATIDRYGAGLGIDQDIPGLFIASDRPEVSATKTITAATFATPIQITTSTVHGYSSGDRIAIYDVGGNTNANGVWTITVVDTSNFTLNSSVGNAAYTSGGLAANRGVLYGIKIVVLPSVGRTGFSGPTLNGDDVACIFLANAGTGRATDLIYIGSNTNIAQDAISTFTSTANSSIFLRSTGAHSLKGIDMSLATMGIASNTVLLAASQQITIGDATLGRSAPGVFQINGSLNMLGTTNQVIFGATNLAPVSSAAPTKWISVQVTGESAVYRLPLYE